MRSRRVVSGLIIVLLLTSLSAPVVDAEDETPVVDAESESRIESHPYAQMGSESGRSYQIVQGSQVIPVEPIDGNESVEAFYDYRHPYVGSRDDPSWGRSFSSRGTTEYQQNDTSILLLYEGPQGVSLVAVHDKYVDGSEGTDGGSISWTVSGLPEGGEWAVIDDEYGWLTNAEQKDDIFRLGAAHRAGAPGNDGAPPGDADALLSWVWSTGRTDGVAFRGLGTDAAVVINPAFNDDSYHRYGDRRRPDVPPNRPGVGEGYNGTVDDWEVVASTAIDDDGEREIEEVDLDSLDEPIVVRSTSTPPAPRSVSLETDRIEPGDSVRLSAVIENRGGTDWTYEAKLKVFDTTLQTESVTVPAGEERTVEFTQQFGEPGRYEIGVGDERSTLTVGDPPASDGGSPFDDPDETDTNDDGGGIDERVPGFGPVAALVALVVVAVGAKRRAKE